MGHLFFELIALLLHQAIGQITEARVRAERRKQAKRLLRHGRELLRQGRREEADTQFGAAMKLNPRVVDVLSKRQQRKFLGELVQQGGGLNASHLWIQLEGLAK